MVYRSGCVCRVNEWKACKIARVCLDGSRVCMLFISDVESESENDGDANKGTSVFKMVLRKH